MQNAMNDALIILTVMAIAIITPKTQTQRKINFLPNCFIIIAIGIEVVAVPIIISASGRVLSLGSVAS